MEAKNKCSDIIYFVLVAVLFLVAVILRTISFLGNVYNIHGDECHSLYGSIIPLKDVFTYYVQGTNFLPLYKLLMKFIHYFFGFNWFVIKLPSLIFSVISVFLFYKILQKIFQSRFVILCCLFLFSVNYTLLHFTMFAKPYTMEVCLNLLLFIMFLDIQDKIKTEKLNNSLLSFILWTIFSAVCIFSSIPILVMVAFYWGFLFIQSLIHKNKSVIVKIFTALTLFFVVFLFEYLQLLHKISADVDLNSQWFCPDYFAIPNSMEAINSLIHFVFFEFKYFDSGITNVIPPVFIIMFVALFFISCFLLISYKKICGFSIVIPFIFFILLSFLHIFPFNNRCITFLIPFFIVIFFYVFDFLIQKYKILGSIVLFVIFSLFVYQISHNYEKYIGVFTFSDSKNNQEIISTAKNANANDTVFIAFETVCSFCLNNDKMIYIDQGWHTDDVVKNYFYSKTNSFPSKIDKSYIYDKKKVYILAHMPLSEHMQEHYYRDFLILQKMLLDYGFVEVVRTEDNLFITYILYEKE